MTLVARQRIWLAALCLYFAAGATDMSAHLLASHRKGEQIGPNNIPVAFAAGLFWPMDIVATILLAR